MIKINNLVKKYGSLVAVDGLNLEVRENEVFALLGLNGAGKTTTIRILASLTRKTSGSVTVAGYDIERDNEQIRRLIGVAPQETAVAGNLTVRENLDLMADLYHVQGKTAKINNIIERFGLTTKADCRAKTLSGGQKRRLSLAMALIPEPKILILDEPTLGLDIKARKDLWNIIGELKGKMSIVLTTHYLEEAEALADRICIMRSGKSVAIGTAYQIMEAAGQESFEQAFLALAGGEDD